MKRNKLSVIRGINSGDLMMTEVNNTALCAGNLLRQDLKGSHQHIHKTKTKTKYKYVLVGNGCVI